MTRYDPELKKYIYKVVDDLGDVYKSFIIAYSEKDAKTKLKKKGYYLIEISVDE